MLSRYAQLGQDYKSKSKHVLHYHSQLSQKLGKMKCWLPLAALALTAGLIQAEYRVVCYFESWAVYRPGKGKFDVEDVDPSLCTHHVYTFVGVGTDGSVKLLDSWNDIDEGAIKRFNAMRDNHPGIKTMVAIGGWNEGSKKFSKVVNDDATRAKFVDNIVTFVKEYDFNGFDVDWEYPTQRGGSYSDRETFVQLLSELRTKFDENGFLLSAAVSAGEETIDAAYDVPGISKYLDFINVMTYDLHGDWDSVTGENAPLYPGDYDNEQYETTLNVDAAIDFWISKGAPKSKLNLGLGTYGRSFTLQSSSKYDVGSPIAGSGQPGPYTEEAGMLGYNEICENKWTEVWNEPQKVPYAYKGNQWVGYDNVDSFKIKAQYIVDKGLGGAMIWAIDTDDFLGTCGGGKYPLLTALNAVLSGETSGTEPSKPDTSTSSDDRTGTPITTTPTTEASTVTPPPGICITEGFVRDPSNCQVFYLCQNVNGRLDAIQYFCSDGTVFDPSISGCNYASLVNC